MKLSKGFSEISLEEMREVDGGDLGLGIAIALGGAVGAAVYLAAVDLHNCYTVGYAEGKALR